jgi:hypothetical protein
MVGTAGSAPIQTNSNSPALCSTFKLRASSPPIATDQPAFNRKSAHSFPRESICHRVAERTQRQEARPSRPRASGTRRRFHEGRWKNGGGGSPEGMRKPHNAKDFIGSLRPPVIGLITANYRPDKPELSPCYWPVTLLWRSLCFLGERLITQVFLRHRSAERRASRFNLPVIWMKVIPERMPGLHSADPLTRPRRDGAVFGRTAACAAALFPGPARKGPSPARAGR